MSSYQPGPVGAAFRHCRDGCLQDDELPFREVFTAAQIEQVAAAEQVAFGGGADAVYSVPLTLWALIAQVLSDQKSCVAAVARVLVLLAALGRPACHAGTGAYCKARAKLSEALLRRLACTVGRHLE